MFPRESKPCTQSKKNARALSQAFHLLLPCVHEIFDFSETGNLSETLFFSCFYLYIIDSFSTNVNKIIKICTIDEWILSRFFKLQIAIASKFITLATFIIAFMTEDNTKEVNKYSKHLESTSQNIKYAIDRFDILIISLSSGGLLFTTSLVKDFTDGCHCHASSLYLMKLAWGCFVLSICSNLISQVSSYFANTYELKIVKQIVRNKKDENNKIDVSKDEKAKSKYNKMTEYLNAASLIFFLLAVILSFTYFSKII